MRVTRECRDLFSTTKMGYAYSRYFPAPSTLIAARASTLVAVTAAAAAQNAFRVAAASSPAYLGAGATTGMLLRLPDARPTQVLGLDVTGGRAQLVLSKLHAWKQPGVLYHVYLSGRRGDPQDEDHYVGAINFFDAEFHEHGGGSRLDEALGENFQSFDVTEVLQRIAARPHGNDISSELFVSFVPGGKPMAGADPMVAEVELFVQPN